jgi:hypothetical protein
MSANTTRRLRQEDQQRATMRTRVAQWRRRTQPCTCHACQALAAIRAMVAAGQVVQLQDVGVVAHPEPESTRH